MLAMYACIRTHVTLCHHSVLTLVSRFTDFEAGVRERQRQPLGAPHAAQVRSDNERNRRYRHRQYVIRRMENRRPHS